MGARVLSAIFTILLVGIAGCATTPDPGKALAEDYYNLGNEWFDLKKYDKAAQAYRTALSWSPDLRIATVNLARTRAELGDTSGALDLLAPLAVSDPDNLVVAQYLAWLTAKKNGPAAAADLYLALATRIPGDPNTQFNAGLSLEAADRGEEALRALKAWKALDGKSSVGLSALAELLEKAADPSAADAWLDVASSLPENDPKRFSPLVRQAKALEASRLFGDAVRAWDAALALPAGPDQNRGEAQFRRGTLLLLQIEDYQKGSQGLIDAWKTGFTEPAAWKALRDDPALKYGPRLEADLKLAGVTP